MYISLVISERSETTLAPDVQSTEEKLTDLRKHLGNRKDEGGIIRCCSRLNNATIETRSPILLPKKHYCTQLVIWDCHCEVLHNGTKKTLQELRSRFCLNQGRQRSLANLQIM